MDTAETPALEWYAVYRARGGLKSAGEFERATSIFVETTHDAFVLDIGSRVVAVERCMREMKCEQAEFDRIFNAINAVTPYS